MRFRPRLQFRHPAVRRLLALSGWTLGYVVANQVTIVVVRNLADPGSGDARAYFDAFTFFVLPHGLLAVSIATTFAPEMARSVARRDRAVVLRPGVARHPARRPADAARRRADLRAAAADRRRPAASTASTPRPTPTTRRGPSAGFALGLVGFSVYLFVLRGFYAHQDTRTPFVINVVQNVLNIALAVALVGRYDILGLAAALAVSYVLCALWALQVLSYKVPGFPLRDRARQPVADRRRRRHRRRGDVARRQPGRRRRRAPGRALRMIVGGVVGIGRLRRRAGGAAGARAGGAASPARRDAVAATAA